MSGRYEQNENEGKREKCFDFLHVQFCWDALLPIQAMLFLQNRAMLKIKT